MSVEYTLPGPEDLEVLSDVDGVSADFLERAYEVLEKISGKKYDHKEMTSWDMFDHVPREYEEACFEEFKKEGFCHGLSMYPGSKEGVKRLLKEYPDHTYFVTSPIHGPFWSYERALWLRDKFQVPAGRVISTSAKHQVFGDALIDDRYENLVIWLRRWPASTGILWTQNYNRKYDLLPNMVRVSSWDEVLEVLADLKARKSSKSQ